jgi:hypothetical protein
MVWCSYPELNVEKVQGTWDNMSISRMSEEEKARRRAELVQQKRDVLRRHFAFPPQPSTNPSATTVTGI